MNDDNSGYALFDFNPNDNVSTEIICNDVPFNPDYLITFDENGAILQRWFVMRQYRNRQGQWKYVLRRDVLADNYDSVLSGTVYVEKAIIKDENSPLLLNSEGLSVNQIKKSELLLKDKTQSAWLVMYIKKGVLGDGQYNSITVNIPNEDVEVYKTLTTPISSWKFYAYQSADMKVAYRNTIEISVHLLQGNLAYRMYKLWMDDNPLLSEGSGGGSSQTNRQFNGTDSQCYSAMSTVLLDNSSITSMKNAINTDFGYASQNDLDELLNYEGKIIKDSLGKYYEVRRVYQNPKSYETETITSALPTIKSALDFLWNIISGYSIASNDHSYKINNSLYNYRIELVERTDIETTIDLSTYTGNGTTDSMLFDVICMPYGEVEIKDDALVPLIHVTSSANRSLKVMSALARHLTSQNVLDLQLIPYLPAVYLNVPSDGHILLTQDYNDTAVFGKYGGVPTDVIIVSSVSNFTLDLPYKVYIDTNDITSKTYKIKYLNDCTMVRLCSPNYNGVFEMNLAKNGDTLGYGGDINGFNADITLKPYNPYIHVTPNFSSLYGRDFDDYRGLICGGDFSLGIIDDAWQNSELQNKNYQAIFDRQIQNMEVNNSITKQESLFGAIAGTVQGGATGAAAGGFAGGPWGAVAGAVVGAGASAIGGAIDLANLEKRQKEAISYAIDNYKLQLGNIKALPYSITRTNAITYNNKLFPFVEIYECTQEEKMAYIRMLKYNGMTVGVISMMSEFERGDWENFFRGKLVPEVTNVLENNVLEAIQEELLKGVFI